MKEYLVKGIAFVPVEVEMTIEAKDEKQAEKIALERFKQPRRDRYIVSNSEEHSSVFDWVPSRIEEISPEPSLDGRSA
jgi:hypothetical protein